MRPLVFAPPGQPNTSAREALPAYIEGVILLPPVIGLRSKGVLETLYRRQHLSALEIERLLGVSHAGVLEALDRFAIPRKIGRADYRPLRHQQPRFVPSSEAGSAPNVILSMSRAGIVTIDGVVTRAGGQSASA